MLAAVRRADDPRGALRTEQLAIPQPRSGEVLLRVRACGVCRTDLHIVDAELPPHRDRVVPGHQIVGEVTALGEGVDRALMEARVGVSWLGGTDGTCPQCRAGRENLCDHPTYTGYDRDGGYAQFACARADFAIPLPEELDDLGAAPLLCAGIIGFRALRVAGVQPGERVGLFGFGSSAHLALQVLRNWNCDVYVATRGEAHREFARRLGAVWVGEALDRPPAQLDRAVTFAPAGDVVVAALASLRKGGVVAINAIHLDGMPSFDYDSLLWGERQIRSVTNMTRDDARDFLRLAASARIAAATTEFALADAAAALDAVRNDRLDGSSVIRP
ncbi:MAG: zinc-binding alcohol dehydrogenase family protein [Candidatus Eremiobacteraeota bacterium]|nr:zinc-binding alcohol dehydrogenase family protein [Candidatus Eremiobacteraeota bacterium]